MRREKWGEKKWGTKWVKEKMMREMSGARKVRLEKWVTKWGMKSGVI